MVAAARAGGGGGGVATSNRSVAGGVANAAGDDPAAAYLRGGAAALAKKPLEFHVPVKAGPRLIGVAFVERDEVRDEEVLRPRNRGTGPEIAVEVVTISGPYNRTGPGDTPSRRRIFVCRPASASDEEPCAQQILLALERRAYRRPVTAADAASLMPFYRAGRAEGGFDVGIERALGVVEAHHPVSHHRNDPDLISKKARIDRYHVELLACFLQKLQATKDGDGTLLDQSLILYGGGMGDGNLHRHNNLPCLTAGKLGGKFETGRHLAYQLDTPMSNLLVTILQNTGVPIDKIGDSTGPLAV